MDVDYDIYAEGEALLGWLNLSAARLGPSSMATILPSWVAICGPIDRTRHRVGTFEDDAFANTATIWLLAIWCANQSNVELSHELAEPVRKISVAQSSRRGRSRATEASVEEEYAKLP